MLAEAISINVFSGKSVVAGAGFEPELTKFSNLLMAREFWSNALFQQRLEKRTYCFGVLVILQESTRVLETSLTTSALSRDTFSVQAAGAGSHKPRVGGGGRASVGQRCRVSTPQRSKIFHSINDGVAHQTSLRSQRDHDDSCELPCTGGGSPIHFAGHDRRTTSPHRHPRIQASPLRRSCATAKLFVVDLIA